MEFTKKDDADDTVRRRPARLAFSVFSVSVSVQIVAGRDDFAERGSVSRSRLIATDALDLSKRWAAGEAPAGHRPALLWLRFRSAVSPRLFGFYGGP